MQWQFLPLLQHEPYSWEIQAGDFVYAQDISGINRFADKAITNWLQDMTPDERSAFVDAFYDLLCAGGANNVMELIHPKNILAFFKALATNDESRKLLTGEMVDLIDDGVKNILCLQPFACLPNHVAGKGMLKALRQYDEKANIVAIDYDPGASTVNQLNRIKLMMSTAFKNLEDSKA